MNKQDINNILTFLNRTQLSGNEALELVRLQQLLTKIASETVSESKVVDKVEKK